MINYMPLGELMKLFMIIENGSNHDFNIKLYDYSNESHSCVFFDGSKEIGLINYVNTGLFSTVNKPSIDMSIVDNTSKTPHLGHYLMACFMLYNASNLTRNSQISFNGFNDHRRGELESILNEYTIDDTFGGPKSQMLHLNFGFKPNVSKEVINRIFTDLDSFDVSDDFISENNDNDSLFSKVVCTQLNSWYLNGSETVNELLSTAYFDFIKSFFYIKKYISLNKKNTFNKFDKKSVSVYSNRLKNCFINSYKSIYKKTLNGFKKLRLDLKKDLLNTYDNFNNLLNLKLVSLIEPFLKELHAKYLIDISNSRGMKEFYHLVNDFNPCAAGIAMPKPELVKDNFDLIVDYLANQKYY